MADDRRSKEYLQEEEGEKGAEWYDASFEDHEHWKAHYTQSGYYFLWTVIRDRMIRSSTSSILEIGCGSGQLACLIRDTGIERYCGFDFSSKRIEQAASVCPEFEFNIEDAFQTDLFVTAEYDTVVCTEFLEHVQGDLEVLQRIRSGTKFFGTVPNFRYISHVRHFERESDVISRYGSHFQDFTVDTLLKDEWGRKFYLMEGWVN